MRSNPFEEGEIDAEHGVLDGSLNPNEEQGKEQDPLNQEEEISPSQVQSLFSVSRPEINILLDGLVLGVSKASYGQVLLCWTP